MIDRRTIQHLLALCLCTGLVSCVGEQRLQVAEVPPVAVAAAEAAVEGLQIVSAQTEAERGETLYELGGTAGGQAFEIEVTADGRVIEVEADD